MVENGTIRRAEVVTRAIATVHGFRVGDPSAKVEAFYGRMAQRAPDKYDPAARTITIGPTGIGGATLRTVFKVKNGAVFAIFAGALPQVAYVEGCS
jgi:hypothetical protein